MQQTRNVRARLLDVVPGRSGTAYSRWLAAQPAGFTATVEHAALDPFRGYANAIRDELPNAVAVLDAFHVVKLGTAVVDEVRRRVQEATLGHRGHKDDPLYKIRGLLRHGVEHLSARQVARLEAALEAGDPAWEVTTAWGCYERLRSIYDQRTAAAGKVLAEDVIATLQTCPIPEVARLGPTLRAWRTQVLAYFDTDGVSNGGTEAINLIIEKTRRLAHGFRTFAHYRLRILLAASGTRPGGPITLKSEEPDHGVRRTRTGSCHAETVAGSSEPAPAARTARTPIATPNRQSSCQPSRYRTANVAATPIEPPTPAAISVRNTTKAIRDQRGAPRARRRPRSTFLMSVSARTTAVTRTLPAPTTTRSRPWEKDCRSPTTSART